MTTFRRNANVVKQVTLSKLEKERSTQIEHAFKMLGKNKQVLFTIMNRYHRSRRFWFVSWLPIFRSLSYQYHKFGTHELWAIEWKCGTTIFQFVNDGAGWNTICVYEHGNEANIENLKRLKVNLVRAFPFYTIHVHKDMNPI